MNSDHAKRCLHVLLVGCHPALRHSLREIIEAEPDLQVVAEARDIQEAVTAARSLAPDAVVLDIALAGDRGVAALCGGRRAAVRPRIIMVGLTADREHVRHALRAGACGYLRTQDAAEELVAALRTACPENPFLGAAVDKKEILGELRCAPAGYKVLVVEDDADFAEIVRTTLESAHYSVIAADSKEEGLRLARCERPDCIILDVMMPSGIEGFHFVWELRKDPDEATREIPILILTAIHDHTGLRFYPEQSDSTYGSYEYLPVQDFVDKPVSPHQLLAKVGDLLAGRATRQEQVKTGFGSSQQT